MIAEDLSYLGQGTVADRFGGARPNRDSSGWMQAEIREVYFAYSLEPVGFLA